MKLNLTPDRRILAQFAWVALVALPLLAAMLTGGQWTGPWTLGLLALGALQLVLFLCRIEAPTRWLFLALSLIAFPIGFVLSHVLMASIFYLVVTPIGLAFRLIGRDAMQRRFDRDLGSYWRQRGPQRPPASYFELY